MLLPYVDVGQLGRLPDALRLGEVVKVREQLGDVVQEDEVAVDDHYLGK